ncbi:MAG: hypothetical protein ABUS51_01880 [Acidobacteriota bacterium]
MKILLLAAGGALAFAQSWAPQTSHTTATLRGIAAVSDQVVWASGTAGTWLRTTDGGSTWRPAVVAGAEALDFRGVQTLDGRTAWLMSSGAGEQSRIYQTLDAGEHWKLLFTNPDPNGFFNALAFRDARHGVLAGDPVDGRMTVFTTDDGGRHWSRQRTPPALPEEGSFAASNSCLRLAGKSDIWLATGGRGAARIFHSGDAGRTWKVATTPILNDGPGAGIFSLAFVDTRHGVAVGGDYTKPGQALGNIAFTADGGLTWAAPPGSGPSGFRSAAAWLTNPGLQIVTGPSGSDVSADNGRSWKRFDDGAYNALGVFAGRAVWAAGPRGRIARLSFPNR